MPSRMQSIMAKRLTSSGQVSAAGTAGLLYGYVIKTGTTATTVAFTNGSGGTSLWQDGWAAQTAAGDVYVSFAFPQPVEFTADIYCTIAGTGAEVSICYGVMNY